MVYCLVLKTDVEFQFDFVKHCVYGVEADFNT